MKSKETRQKEATERLEAYNSLSIEQKLAKLPPEPQAARQRAKLLAQLEGKNKKVEPETPEVQGEEKPKKAKERKSKERRQ